MRFWNRSVLWVMVLVLLTSAAGWATVTDSDIARLKAKFEAGERFTSTDVRLAEEHNAAVGQTVFDLNEMTDRAKLREAGLWGRENRRPGNPLDVYVFNTVPYEWIDIDAVGTALTNTNLDDWSGGPYDLGFSFPFYDVNYTQIRVCTNGFLQLEGSSTTLTNGTIPTTATPNAAIYPFWDDMDAGDPGAGFIKYYSDVANQRFVVSWLAVPHYYSPYNVNHPYTFQAVVYANGNIQFNYQTVQMDTVPTNTSCTVGIENQAGTQAIQVCYNSVGTLPTSGSSILIGQPDGIPNAVTNLMGNYVAPDAVLTWVDPTHDTNGNVLAIDSVQIFLGNPAGGLMIGHVARGIQTFTHLAPPNGNNQYYVRAKAGDWTSAPVAVTVAVGSPVYNMDFEADGGLWASAGGWEWGAPTNPNAPAPHSGSNMWGVGMAANYDNNVCYTMDLDLGLNVLDGSALIEFWAYYQTEGDFTPWDGCNIQGSVDGGNTWEVLTPSEPAYDDETSNNTCIGASPCWNGTQYTDWLHVIVPIGQFAGQAPMFRFTFGTDGSVTYPGFFIDDMTIWGLQPFAGAPVSGTITLDGGAGAVTNVLVRSSGLGSPQTNPLANGTYSMPSVQVGNRIFTATLAGYVTATLQANVPDGGLTNVNMTLRREIPTPPADVTLTVNDATGVVTLNWTASADPLVDGYRIYRKLQEAIDWTTGPFITGRTTVTGTDQLTAAGVYNYRITAVDNDVLPPAIESEPALCPQRAIYGPIPPVMLIADGDYDNKIHLSWREPGTPPEIEVFYDQGTNSPGIDGIGWWGGLQPFGWLVAHYQGEGAITVTRLKTYFTSFATLGDAIQVGVFADDGTGLPTFEPLGVVDAVHEEPFDAFREFELPEPQTFTDGSFFVGARQVTANALCVGGDEDSPFITNTFFYSGPGTAWTPYEPGLMAIPMQRAFVIGNMGEEVELAPSPVRGLSKTGGFPISAPEGLALGKNSSSKRTLSEKDALAAIEAGRPSVSRTHHPVDQDRLVNQVPPQAPHMRAAAAHGRRPNNTTDEVTNYLIYRDNFNPTSQIATVPATALEYDDTPLAENIQHTYWVRARYSNNQLSDTSNGARKACNMPPAAPSNVQGQGMGSAMQVVWADPTLNEDGTNCVDLTTLRVYRNGELLNPPVNPGVGTFTDNTVPDPLRRYTWEVRALDEVGNEGQAASWSGYVQSPWEVVDYEWVDITQSGTVCSDGDDITEGPFDLGFNFTFFGNEYTSISICSNGWAAFEGSQTAYFNTCIPSNDDATEPNAAVYAFWDDMNSGAGGDIYYYADASNQQFVISWVGVYHYGTTTPYTYQIIIRPDGSITYNYQDIPDNSSCTIGIENSEGTEAVELLCNGVGDWTPEANTAVQFYGGPSGHVMGVIRSADTPPVVIAGATITAMQDGNPVSMTSSNAQGQYDLRVGPGTYSVVMTHDDHCSRTYSNVVVAEDQTVTMDGSLQTPTYVSDHTSLNIEAHRNMTTQATFVISNPAPQGQCPLDFTITDDLAWMTVNPSTGTINPGDTRTITVSVTPTVNTGDYTGHLTLNYNAPSAPALMTVLIAVIPVTLVEDVLPTTFALHSNYPNPFNPTTVLPFDIPQQSHVEIALYNVMGQEVMHLVSGDYAAGRYNVTVDAKDLPSGMYMVKMTAGSFTSMGKMMLLK